MRPRISIWGSVRPSVRPSVGPSVRPWVTLSSKTGKSMILIANNDVSCNLIIIQSFQHHEDASFAVWALFQRTTGLQQPCLMTNDSDFVATINISAQFNKWCRWHCSMMHWCHRCVGYKMCCCHLNHVTSRMYDKYIANLLFMTLMTIATSALFSFRGPSSDV